MSINFQELRDLLGAISQTDITELTLKNDDFELVIRKDNGGVSVPQVVNPSPPSVVEALTSNTLTTNPLPVVETTPTETISAPKVDDKKWVDITSPMVGTFYAAPAPDEDPFFSVGDRINKGDTVCIIEAMKLMNEIEGEISGQIMEIMVENGEPVEFGQVLMRVDPA